MAKRPKFFNGGLYHVYNRGTDKRKITSGDSDRARFVYDLFAFNTKQSALMTSHRFKQFRGPTPKQLFGNRKELEWKYEFRSQVYTRGEGLVDIIAWALMPNHYHLLIRQRVNDGVSEYMKKLGAGYTMYFNEIHERSGALFQGKYKVKQILDDEYLRHLVAYIHLNPLAMALSKWEEKGSKENSALIKELLNYRWSSLRDYLGDENFKALLSWKQIEELGLPVDKEHYNLLDEWLCDLEGYYDIIFNVAIDNLSV